MIVDQGFWSPPDYTTLNASEYGTPGSPPTHGCPSNGTFMTNWSITCFTCLGVWYYATRYLCWQMISMVNCTTGPPPDVAREPLPTGLPKPTRKPRSASFLKEHYERSSESYDREERFGDGGPAGQAAWQAHVPENVRNFYAHESYAALPAPASNYSPMMFLLMALTFGVVIGVGSYVLKKVQKRSEYVPLKEPLDKDNLLLS